jgi:hypothetical protein
MYLRIFDIYASNNEGWKPIEKKYAEEYFEEIIRKINSRFSENCTRLSDLLISLNDECETRLYSCLKEIYDKYSTLYNEQSFENVSKYEKNYEPFFIEKSIPSQYLINLNTMNTKLKFSQVKRNFDWLDLYIIKNTTLVSIVDEILTECQAYWCSSLETAKQGSVIIIKEMKAFYLEQLWGLLNMVILNLSQKFAVEQKNELQIKTIEIKINCLDDSQAEINKRK